MKVKEEKISWFWLLPILLVGFILRFWNLTAVALWHDEAFSTLMVEYPITEMFSRLALDVHPPFYYLAYYGWQEIFSNSVFYLRLFSLVFGLVALIGIYMLVEKTFKDKWLAIGASLIAAVNPFLVLYSQEGRMYTLGLALTVFASYFLIRAVREKKVFFWFLFIVLASAASYTHYYLFFSIFALFIFLVYFAYRQKEKRSYYVKGGLISAAFLVVLYLPWLSEFLDQLNQVQESYWIPEMTIWSVPNTLINLLTGGVVAIGESNWWLGVIIIGLILFLFARGLSYLNQKSHQGMVLILVSFLTPFILAILLSFKQSLYLDRYFIFIVPFYLIIITAGIDSLDIKRYLKLLIVLILAGFMTFSYYQHYQKMEIKSKPGMRGAASYLNNSYEQNDKILVTSSFVYFTFKHYNQTDYDPKLYSPGELSHFSGTALLDEDDIVKNFNEIANSGDKVWLISTSGFGDFRPEPPSDWYKVDEKEFVDSNSVKGSIFIEKYKIFEEDRLGKVKYQL